jgi:FixJ family two-component response regulator
MGNIAEQRVFFLDDDVHVRNVVRRILEDAGIKVRCFSDPATCMAALRSKQCSLLITDVRMPGTDGIEVLKEVKRLAPWIPVLVVSAYGNIETAVRAMKAGAVDFAEKPLGKTCFIRKVKSMLSDVNSTDTFPGKSLTQAETTVLGLVVDGKSSKEIARLLHRSTRTIEGPAGSCKTRCVNGIDRHRCQAGAYEGCESSGSRPKVIARR